MAYALIWVGFMAYLAVLAWAPRLGGRVVWGAIALFLAAFACLPPILSHDVYSYVDYARLAVLHGFDPYVRGPAAAPGDPAFPHVTWQHTASVYGPVFTLVTYPLALLSVGGAVYVLKAASAGAVLGIAVVVARVAPARGVDPLRVAAFVALNPLVLAHVVGGPHNDSFAVLLTMVGVAGVLLARELSGGAALVAAVAVKASAAVTVPFAVLGAASHPPTEEAGRPPTGPKAIYTSTLRPVGGVLAGMAVAAVAIGVVAYAAFGWDWLNAFELAGEGQGRTTHLSLPALSARLLGLGGGTTSAALKVLYAGLLAYLLAWTYRGGDWVRAAAWATTGLLLATSWLLPWYLLWPLPLAALSRDRPLQLLLLALTAYQLGARIPL